MFPSSYLFPFIGSVPVHIWDLMTFPDCDIYSSKIQGCITKQNLTLLFACSFLYTFLELVGQQVIVQLAGMGFTLISDRAENLIR